MEGQRHDPAERDDEESPRPLKDRTLAGNARDPEASHGVASFYRKPVHERDRPGLTPNDDAPASDDCLDRRATGPAARNPGVGLISHGILPPRMRCRRKVTG